MLADRPSWVEIVVVDNGSSDRTPAAVASRPGVEYVLAPDRGLARARNRGLAVARGELVAFLDDDARPERGWAKALLAARARWPFVAAIGGPVRLELGAPRPSWLVPELTRWFSAVDHGPVARLLRAGEDPVGANLALAREQALAIGGFAPELGRVGSSLGSDEEVDLLRRLRHAGGDIGWEPSAAVRHLVPPERMTRRWLLRRAWAQGRSDTKAARLAGMDHRIAESAKLALRSIFRGWRQVLPSIRAAEVREGAMMRELARRARMLGRAAR